MLRTKRPDQPVIEKTEAEIEPITLLVVTERLSMIENCAQ
jgi:hypothetical protein